MPNLRVRPAAAQGHVHHVTPESAGWTHVGFDLHKLPNPGDIAKGSFADREVCIVLISGRASIEVDGQTFGQGDLVVFSGGANAMVSAAVPAVVMLLGGEPLGERFIEWNFVSSSKARIAVTVSPAMRTRA